MMKWRCVDRVTAFAPWEHLTARKAFSFEEMNLLERWGRAGELPPSLLLECGVEAARWLVAASSGFQLTGLLAESSRFAFCIPLTRESVLAVKVRVRARDAEQLTLACQMWSGPQLCAEGELGLALRPLTEIQDGEWLQSQWRELRAHEPAA